MARSVNIAGSDIKDSKSTGFDPIPAGTYNVTIYDYEVKQVKPGSANAGRDFLALQLRISEPQKGANRRLFVNVFDFPRWAPKAGKSEGSVNFLFFQFYKALGVDFPDGVDGEVDLPDYEDLQGSSVAVKVVITQDDYRFKNARKDWIASGEKGPEPEAADFLKNEVKEFLAEQDADDLATDEDDDDEDDFDL